MRDAQADKGVIPVRDMPRTAMGTCHAGHHVELLDVMRRLRKIPASIWPVFYEESLFALHAKASRRDRITPALHHIGHNIHYLHDPDVRTDPDRPPSEVAAHWLGNILDTRIPDMEDILCLSRMLGGSHEFRTSRIGTTRFYSGHWFEFLPHHAILSALYDLMSETFADHDGCSLCSCYCS